MDVIPMCSIFQELQIVHDTGYFSALPSLEEYWQQVTALPSSSADAHFDRSAARPRSTRSVEVARNARLFLGKLGARTEARGRASGVYAAPRRARRERISASPEELAQTRFLPSFYCNSSRRARESKSGICGRGGLPTLRARAHVCGRLSFAAHFAPRW